MHAVVCAMFTDLRKKGVEAPSLAVLARSNTLIAKISTDISTPRALNGSQLPAIPHELIWDAELTAAAAVVIASILEWPQRADGSGLTVTFHRIADFFRTKIAVEAEKPSKSAHKRVSQFSEDASLNAGGQVGKARAVKALAMAYAQGFVLSGDPVEDWKTARAILAGPEPLDAIYGAARLVRLFRATDALAEGLRRRWVEDGSYSGTADLVRRLLDRDRIQASEREPEGCLLMNIHKSKGKEYDGVIIVEGPFSGRFPSAREAPPHLTTRRVLRVAITRARRLVTIVRPADAMPLA